MQNIKDILDRLKEFYQIPNNRQLSNKIDVNYNTMATWIKRNIVPYEKLNELSQKENISFDWLLNGENGKYTNLAPKPIESKEDNRDSEDLPYVLLFDEFEKVSNNPSMKLILNKPKKIYRDNPLFRYLNIREDISKLDEIICLDDISYGAKSYVSRYHIQDMVKYTFEIDNAYVPFSVIIKNNLFKENYPLYEDKYLGVEGSISQSRDNNNKIIFKMDSYLDNVLYSSEIQLTKDEFKNLTIFAFQAL